MQIWVCRVYCGYELPYIWGHRLYCHPHNYRLCCHLYGDIQAKGGFPHKNKLERLAILIKEVMENRETAEYSQPLIRIFVSIIRLLYNHISAGIKI